MTNSRKHVPLMLAIFLLPSDQVRLIAADDAERAGTKYSIEVEPKGNGAICSAIGPLQEIMFLIGAVAGHGEAALYRAELI